MTQAKHTPGPWRFEPATEYYGATIHFNVARGGIQLHKDMPNGDANARLIAAAPDLLKWCERILLSHETQGAATNGEAVLCHAFVMGLKDVIAKAKGEA